MKLADSDSFADDKAVVKGTRTWRFLKMCSLSLSAVSLITLVVQNALLVLMTRHAKASTRQHEGFHTSTVVLLQEVAKVVVCLVVLGIERKVRSAHEYFNVVYGVVAQPECVKLALPAGLFTLQNFLVFVSLSNLDVMTFQILSQTKLLSAALFSVWLLNRTLTGVQWASLLLLTIGVFLAQYETAMSSSSTKSKSSMHHSETPQHALLGALSCIVSGLSSSFAGVYFEKVVKSTPPSLAVRNIHLGIFGIPFAIVSLLVLDVWGSDDPRGYRFFRGFSAFTWALVAVHALGGLLVAAVVKYADNILKGFATAVAIIVSGAVAAVLWQYIPTAAFVAGCTVVIVAIVMYQVAEESKVRAAKQQQLLKPPGSSSSAVLPGRQGAGTSSHNPQGAA